MLSIPERKRDKGGVNERYPSSIRLQHQPKDLSMDRYTLTTVECDSDDALTPNQRVYKIWDNETDSLGFASYLNKEFAEGLVSKKNERNNNPWNSKSESGV